MKQFFITATDTDAGKTFVSCALIRALTQQQSQEKNQPMVVAAFKPISAGCDVVAGQLINEDAKLLSDVANAKQTIAQINPIAFKEPIAPHIAAKKEGVQLSITDIEQHYQKVVALNADITLVEGAGGWRLPLGPAQESSVKKSPTQENNGEGKAQGYQFLSGFVKSTKLEVILIVNMKLGCLNHALLTYETIKADGLDCIAWIANCAESEPMNNLSENIAELELLLPMPKIAQFNYFPDQDEKGMAISFSEKIHLAATKINLVPLLS
jgi:dethiobiotin synthetase